VFTTCRRVHNDVLDSTKHTALTTINRPTVKRRMAGPPQGPRSVDLPGRRSITPNVLCNSLTARSDSPQDVRRTRRTGAWVRQSPSTASAPFIVGLTAGLPRVQRHGL
jgi:hypothetical protein